MLWRVIFVYCFVKCAQIGFARVFGTLAGVWIVLWLFFTYPVNWVMWVHNDPKFSIVKVEPSQLLNGLDDPDDYSVGKLPTLEVTIASTVEHAFNAAYLYCSATGPVYVSQRGYHGSERDRNDRLVGTRTVFFTAVSAALSDFEDPRNRTNMTIPGAARDLGKVKAERHTSRYIPTDLHDVLNAGDRYNCQPFETFPNLAAFARTLPGTQDRYDTRGRIINPARFMWIDDDRATADEPLRDATVPDNADRVIPLTSRQARSSQ